MKSKKQDSTGIPTLNSLDGEAITEPTEKANVMNENFTSFFTTEKLGNFPTTSYPSMPHQWWIQAWVDLNLLSSTGPAKIRHVGTQILTPF